MLKHVGGDRYSLGRTGGATGQNVQAGFFQRRVVAAAGLPHRRHTDPQRTAAQHQTGRARRGHRAMQLRCPVIDIGENQRQRQSLDVPRDRGGGLVGVDHHHRAARCDEPEDRRRVGNPVTHDDADRFARQYPGLVQCGRDLLDELRDLIARVPLSGEFDERPVTVRLQPGGQPVGEVRACRAGHTGLELG